MSSSLPTSPSWPTSRRSNRRHLHRLRAARHAVRRTMDALPLLTPRGKDGIAYTIFMRRFVLLLSLVFSSTLLAGPRGQQAPAANTPAPPKSGFRAEFLHDVDEVQKKIISLADAMPADKYNWRPAPGVRSVSEVYMHIAGGNYFLATFMGMKTPSYDTTKLEKITDKARVLEELRRSFDHLR